MELVNHGAVGVNGDQPSVKGSVPVGGEQQTSDMAYRFNSTAQKAIDGMRSNLRAPCAAMQKVGLPVHAIRDLSINFANSL